jgi:NitT/TauT family transport system substrate-binding protein
MATQYSNENKGKAGTLALARWVAAALSALLLASPALVLAQKTTVRIGHFPNVTHVQALVAHQLSRQNKGWFEQRLGKDVEVQWFTYNAGPSATEALFANAIDATYVGPSPALNGYFRSKGEDIRILAGAVNGGAALVVRDGAGIKTPADFKGRKFASPQLGNTQDVEFRAWLKRQGYRVTQTGGDVRILPTENPDQLAMLARGDIDGAWTVEPWVSRLELEAKGQVFLEQKDTVTTVLVSSAKFLKDKPELARKVLAAHRELTDWIKANPAEAKKLAQAELTAITRREMPAALLERSWGRLQLTNTVARASLEQFVKDAQDAGFIRDTVDLARLLPDIK